MVKVSQNIYTTAVVDHEADLPSPLNYGVIRYELSDDVPIHIRNSLPAKNDRPFVYVPAGYTHRSGNDNFMKKILSALELSLPNIIVVTAATDGSAEDQLENSFRVQNADSHPMMVTQGQLTDEHVKEILAAKVGRVLGAIVESSIEVGAWILPDSPRRRNGAAQMICESSPNKGTVALGLLGLGEDEEDAHFKESLENSMVPLGCPMQDVSKLVYDLKLKDGAPCPTLTHLLIFESPEEKNIFRQELLSLVPDFIVAFGNITTDAMCTIFDNAKAGSPVVLLQHTGKNIDSLCRMFRHANKHIAKFDEDCSDKKRFFIPPLENEQNDQVRLFLNTWPAGYNSKTIVLADPLIVNGPTIQKRILGAITAAFDLKSGSIDNKIIKRKILDYAWSLYNICNQHSHTKKSSAESLHLQLVFFTFLSIIGSVAYDQVYDGKAPSSKDMLQLTLYILTILLPLYITSLKQESNEGIAMANWGAFKIAAIRIESEIYKFRCQVGQYRVEEKNESALQKPVKVFATNIKQIWGSVKNHLVEDSMVIPSNFWDFDADLFKLKYEPEKQSNVKNLSQQQKNTSATETTSILGFNLGYGSTSSLDADEESPLILGTNNNDEDLSFDSKVKISDDSSAESEMNFIDDKYCPIKADDYIILRMQGAMHKKAGKSRKMSARNYRINFIIKLITIGSGATAALSLQWAVPIVLGFTAALGSGQEFRKYPRRIDVANTMIIQLNELKLWWMGLSMYQKQLPHNKDQLILSTERIISMELESSFDSPSPS